MSELITAKNLDIVIQKNSEIEAEVSSQALKIQKNPSFRKIVSSPQLALIILQNFGLVQMPIEDRFLSGAIYVRDGKIIPVINTALPRDRQYFAAWHEVYHLMFDKVSFSHFIGIDTTMEERKSEYFSACMLLNGVAQYFKELSEMDFIEKIFCCMSTFQSPYKAVLVSLYEYAMHNGDEHLGHKIKEVFDWQIDDLPRRFQQLGLDDSLVKPSYVINISTLQKRIIKCIDEQPELNYHKENKTHLTNIMAEIEMLARRGE